MGEREGRKDSIMELGKHVVDKGILDRDGRRAGKVDDLILECHELGAAGDAAEPEVLAIVSGPLALVRNMPAGIRGFAFHVYRLAGIARPQPTEVAWKHVAAIDVMVHLDISREAAGMATLEQAVERRFIRRIPGA
jgi:hypothetical protein